ncbi:expressed unknown protein [Seminavis robusta]|uniref:WW domain-containing protein n=1 Tax=Seminavis robusta TaxID=568900 RepID=A0A9N8DGN0_9STRA|nr:expressed unknown protein [Seminavis robusta]|eukprot:Sro135_g063860.1 n/a (481) ;mRNA; r:73551-74993
MQFEVIRASSQLSGGINFKHTVAIADEGGKCLIVFQGNTFMPLTKDEPTIDMDSFEALGCDEVEYKGECIQSLSADIPAEEATEVGDEASEEASKEDPTADDGSEQEEIDAKDGDSTVAMDSSDAGNSTAAGAGASDDDKKENEAGDSLIGWDEAADEDPQKDGDENVLPGNTSDSLVELAEPAEGAPAAEDPQQDGDEAGFSGGASESLVASAVPIEGTPVVEDATGGGANTTISDVDKAGEEDAQAGPKQQDPLPGGWEEHVDEKTGETIYYNTKTQATTKYRPQWHADTTLEVKEGEDMAAVVEALGDEVLELEAEIAGELDDVDKANWKFAGRTDECSRFGWSPADGIVFVCDQTAYVCGDSIEFREKFLLLLEDPIVDGCEIGGITEIRSSHGDCNYFPKNEHYLKRDGTERAGHQLFCPNGATLSSYYMFCTQQLDNYYCDGRDCETCAGTSRQRRAQFLRRPRNSKAKWFTGL